MISTLKSEYRALEKKWSREVKTAQKVSSKKKRKAGNRAPSGFVKPTKISDELASFLGKEKGTEMARTEVTRDINKYIRTHNLQDKENGRKINPDTKLAALLKLKKNDELTYFNLQRYMSPHFAKASKEVSKEATA
jgi:upstream activation factor subunit UAF30